LAVRDDRLIVRVLKVCSQGVGADIDSFQPIMRRKFSPYCNVKVNAPVRNLPIDNDLENTYV
jgi:hypothetical protein